MTSRKMRVDICTDHFERLVRNDACSSCPSKVENESTVKALATAMGATEEDRFRSILSEIQSIDRNVASIAKDVHSLEDKVYGNGKPGLLSRLTVIETKQESQATTSKSNTNVIALGIAGLSAIISIVAVAMR